MNETSKMNKLMIMTIMGIIAVCFIIAEIMPHRRTVFHGVVLGAFVSCLNVLHMAYKVRKISIAAAGGSKKRVTLGFSFRIATSILAIVLALEFPHYFNDIAVCASLAAGQFVLFIVGFVMVLNED
ncbi:ATP synthase protein I [Paenibacillus forsythiae]|uniref:ATP synthase protein I n=1 Tax=Paenibacillus forsythiae TaxID=365616 RepID=A0ABU3HB48_9BACL|nr:ATP synthase subunit I [Paenibacillus forsythiae]MDT3428053.1 ATP synthase protein I [Paenibacillus forsythiae]